MMIERLYLIFVVLLGIKKVNCLDAVSVCGMEDFSLCDVDGTSNYINLSGLSYNSTNGKFNGSVITNGCNDHARIYFGSLFDRANASLSICEVLKIPLFDIAESGGALPVLGRAGLTLSGGVRIYSAFEAGFADCDEDSSEDCACSGASCEGGVDVGTCEAHLDYACVSSVDKTLFMDECGGHAAPYHIHKSPVCNYNASNTTGHSTIIGIQGDGYAVYGTNETFTTRPCDLDACHGHLGPVPADSTYLDIPAGSYIYHYHMTSQEYYPGSWTPSCYGNPHQPVDLDTCKAFYDTCEDGDDTTLTTQEYPHGLTVDPYCPCFDSVVYSECNNQTSSNGHNNKNHTELKNFLNDIVVVLLMALLVVVPVIFLYACFLHRKKAAARKRLDAASKMTKTSSAEVSVNNAMVVDTEEIKCKEGIEMSVMI